MSNSFSVYILHGSEELSCFKLLSFCEFIKTRPAVDIKGFVVGPLLHAYKITVGGAVSPLILVSAPVPLGLIWVLIWVWSGWDWA